ncbi:uncharacterized protein si:ch211-284k5.2 [Perca fluviatilis]|uniref:uncharacterized protein si:ch211-284k5.2 n=1 Tax=Perca fluviatilis TaxID=8168 RepID=UPI001965277D|nr:uncharacterized protein si:ch211-284k5.2 [Perca fluviatilis]
MHRSYQPIKPVTNRYLQQRWDLTNYENHRRKVSSALPVVDNKGMKTPVHIQLKLKKIQLQDERLAIIDRDNRLLASKLADIVCSHGWVDHRNHYEKRSLNAYKRREELLLIGRQNLAMHQRITSRQSEYRRQHWVDDWEKAEQLRDNITHYPRGLADKQKAQRKVKFAARMGSERGASCSNKDTGRTDTSRTDTDRTDTERET